MEKVVAPQRQAPRKEAQMRRDLEKAQLANRMLALRNQPGWQDLMDQIQQDFCEQIDALIEEDDVQKAFIIRSNLKAINRFASRIGDAINIGESAKKNLDKKLKKK